MAYIKTVLIDAETQEKEIIKYKEDFEGVQTFINMHNFFSTSYFKSKETGEELSYSDLTLEEVYKHIRCFRLEIKELINSKSESIKFKSLKKIYNRLLSMTKLNEPGLLEFTDYMRSQTIKGTHNLADIMIIQSVNSINESLGL